MSRQLTISSLFSAFALVSLCLFARAGELQSESHPSPEGLVQAEAVSGLPG